MNAHFVSLQNCHIALCFGILHTERSKNAQYKLELKYLLFYKKALNWSSTEICLCEAGSSLLKNTAVEVAASFTKMQLLKTGKRMDLVCSIKNIKSN